MQASENIAGSSPGDVTCDIAALLQPKFFRALCDPKRLAMLVRLLHGGQARTVSQIAETADVDFSVVSRHLALLRDAGILSAEKRKKEVYYSVRTQTLVQTLRAIADALEACCPAEESADAPHGANGRALPRPAFAGSTMPALMPGSR